MSHALTVPTHDHVTAVTLRLLDHIFPLPRAFGVRLWNGLTLPTAGRSPFTLVLHHPATLRRMFSPPIERSLGEAFIYGDYDFEGDLIAAFTLFHVIFERPRSPGEIVDIVRREQADKRGGADADKIYAALQSFGEQDMRDLQILFNLCLF